ncbi:MAG: HD domain-containing protein [Bacteroidia bacterium]|nr:HD domain-containing protein [Bacteroidia bacterium]
MSRANFQGKIINDPVYGFISVHNEILLSLIDHPYFQRLRHISQMGLAQLVYPGARHTRFHHALGVMHLMQEAVKTLRDKGVRISDDEGLGLSIAGLLHDVGHGPFSHALEHALFPVQHEQISLLLMRRLQEQYPCRAMEIAIEIFNRSYPRPFLCSLVSGQLDLDRADYLLRDSFYTGVVEGAIGSDRIMKLMNVHNDELVIEEKGIYSVEKFLLARRLMYWQVYIHKTVISSEHLITSILKRAKETLREGHDVFAPPQLRYFLENDVNVNDMLQMHDALEHFLDLDDNDIISAMKQWAKHKDETLSFLSGSLWKRKLFRIELQDDPFDAKTLRARKHLVENAFPQFSGKMDYLFVNDTVKNVLYQQDNPIKVRLKNGGIRNLDEVSSIMSSLQNVLEQKRYYILYPRA